jgi:hypothetical protein
MTHCLVLKGGESFHKYRIVAILSKSDKHKKGWSSRYLARASNSSQQKKSLCNITKDLELGTILLEISNNRELVVIMTAF